MTFLSVLVGHWFELSMSTAHLATATLGVLLLGLDFGLLALAIGAGTGNRGFAVGIAASVAAASYLVSSMAGVVSWLDTAKYASLFFWSVGDNQLEDGLSLLAAAILGGGRGRARRDCDPPLRPPRPHRMTAALGCGG